MGKSKVWIASLVFCVLSEFLFAQGVHKVVIDAGHGGKDSGTVARSRRHHHEKVIALEIAKKLGSYIERNYKDVSVIYTRKRDVYLTLNQRAKIANKANADLFISIHVDAVGNKSVSGASVYVLGLHRSEDNLKVAMRENAVMLQEEDYETKYAGFSPNNAESYIIFSLMQNQYLSNSMTMAGFVNKHLKSKTKRYTKGVKQAGFYVLREVGMPSVLIETGYITNSSDADYLCSKKGQDKTALAIFNAFRDYKKFMEKHTTNLSAVEVKNSGKVDASSVVAEKVSDNGETFFAVQIAFSSKNINVRDPFFRGLSPIYRYKESKGNRYVLGRTKSYEEGVRLQKKARKLIPDAYLIGIHKGKRVSLSKVKQILKVR